MSHIFSRIPMTNLSIDPSTTRKLSSIRSHGQRGVSLVELMVSMTVGLFLLGAVALIYVNTSSSSRSSALESEMNENASIAMELLQRQIALTGYSDLKTDGTRLFTATAIRGCEGGFGNAGALNSSDKGFADTTLVCSSAGTAGTDSDALAIRYQATLLNSQVIKADASASPPVTQAPANCNYEGIPDWSFATGATANPKYAYAYDRYYIGTDADGSKALFCKGLSRDSTGAVAYGTATALIPNIEDLQIRYAVTAKPTTGVVLPHQILGYVKANHAVLSTANLNGWSRVAGVEICLIARSSGTTPGGADSASKTAFGTYMNCDNTEITNTDGFSRRAYRTTVFLRNLRPGVPTPYKAGTDPWLQQSSTAS